MVDLYQRSLRSTADQRLMRDQLTIDRFQNAVSRCLASPPVSASPCVDEEAGSSEARGNDLTGGGRTLPPGRLSNDRGPEWVSLFPPKWCSAAISDFRGFEIHSQP